MLISIADPILQTQLFALCLFAALFVSLRAQKPGSLGVDTTTELKGFAIIAILLAHIGYYLAADTRFLFPFSVLAGVGVDLFLFLSGFGLAMSALSRELSPLQFYKRRLKKIYLPLWITLAAFFLLDLFVLGKTYSMSYLFHSFLGWFPHANLYSDINSPLWYISLILFYYFIFPWVFSRKHPALSAAAIYAITYAISWWNPGPLSEMMSVYLIHLMAFPLGIAAASWAQGTRSISLIKDTYIATATVGALIAIISYFAIHSGVGKEHWIAEGMSLLTLALIIIVFLLKRFEIRLFTIFGIYSFEMYLVHWPILYRYDVLFKHFPAWIAMLAYAALFLAIGVLLQRAVKFLDRE